MVSLSYFCGDKQLTYLDASTGEGVYVARERWAGRGETERPSVDQLGCLPVYGAPTMNGYISIGGCMSEEGQTKIRQSGLTPVVDQDVPSVQFAASCTQISLRYSDNLV